MEQISDDLLQIQKERLMTDNKLQNMIDMRNKLPVAAMKNQIMETINENSVVIIRGNTGCGKTTQVRCSFQSSVYYNTPFKYLLLFVWRKSLLQMQWLKCPWAHKSACCLQSLALLSILLMWLLNIWLMECFKYETIRDHFRNWHHKDLFFVHLNCCLKALKSIKQSLKQAQ